MKVFQKNSNIFNLLSEGVSEGIIVVNEKQLIVANNSSTEEMFGYEKDELVGNHLELLIPASYHHAHKGHFKDFMNRSQRRPMGQGRELYGIRKNGEEFPLEVGLNPFSLYGNTYVMALIVDITERRNYTERLELEVKERTEQLQEALSKERELNELKTRFLSLVSHEFKTPLSSILTSTTLLSKYTQTEQQEKRNKHIDTIRNKVKYLDTILNDFLSVERLETGKVNYRFTTFPLSKLVNQVIYDANMLLKVGQQIQYPEQIDDFVITCDEKILELILSNLVHNAIKYSSEDTVIDIQIRQKGNNLIMKIIDQGMGIPESDQKFIFNRYFRAKNALLSQGTGIGLNIVKQHIENLGGCITFNSQENKGSTFTVEIPMNPEP
ncbi:PAS domain-containing sensor histidine kinase [Spongiimicrobium sp. 2-473A-2-J]|uniref:PAS domain-containing sensor histidine kinase n=1 Tax=Eudoraea algarum TaxID=3417568 RepID=UPI003D365D40